MNASYSARTAIASAIIPALVVAGCTAEADTCNADGYAELLGSNIAAVMLPAGLNMRIVNETDLVTTDFDPERLNIEVVAQGVIHKISCG